MLNVSLHLSSAEVRFPPVDLVRAKRCLSQFIKKLAMEINVREWSLDDLSHIQHVWLDYCRNIARSDMQLKADANVAMRRWLAARYRAAHSFGYVAEANRTMAGFLIGRLDDWESIPPVIEARRIGIIDAVFVADEYRRQGIASGLIERAVARMRAANAVAVETVYDAWNNAPAQVWHRAGFAPWMVHAYRML
jgi:GNAT superfamily N-acetyltransferase